MGDEDGADGRAWHYHSHAAHIDPIVVTDDGESLEVLATNDRDRSSVTEMSFLRQVSLRHVWCGGAIDVSRVTKNRQAMNCRACNLRVKVALGVETIRGLRQYFAMTLVGPAPDAPRPQGNALDRIGATLDG